jgi:oxygen-independent coproporphyrinogen III oxidase
MVVKGEAKYLRERMEWMTDSVGVYISVPFCKAKCTYCNFASGVFGAEKMDRYVDRVCGEIWGVRGWVEENISTITAPSLRSNAAFSAQAAGHPLAGRVDTIFFGGGTPSLLSAEQMRWLFAALRGEFEVAAGAEITLECAPGQLGEETLQEMLRQGMNRVSFGVQSFVNAEAKAVGRLHTGEMCVAEIARMRAAGVEDINVDLIAGLPGQTAASWRESVRVALETGVPHVSVYMLEVDEDSRLGREVLKAGNKEPRTGTEAKYGADAVPSDDAIAEWYGAACGWLEAGGVKQYEISNFARAGRESRHNRKYWRREPYVGFGLDAHSMLRAGDGAVRWANGDDLDGYLGSRAKGDGVLVQLASERSAWVAPVVEVIDRDKAFEESMFLGLRMNDGVELEALRAEFGEALVGAAEDAMRDVEEAGLILFEGGRARLTAEGRMASNEVFSRLLVGVVA